MPGFCGICGSLPDRLNPPAPSKSELCSTVESEITFARHYVKQFVIPKFLGDKLFFDGVDLFVCTDGTLLNAKDLRAKYSVENNSTLFETMYRAQGIDFVSELRGDFSGLVYDKSEERVYLFTNHIGSKTIYYFLDEDRMLIYGSDLQIVLDMMGGCRYETELSELGAYFLLTFGYMLNDTTLCSTVRKLPPGSILCFDLVNCRASIETYYRLENTPYISDTRENILKEMDKRFEDAIRKEYDKDLEYGYRHVATLSGGLDSRMTVTKGKMLGYDEILAVTFSQSDYLDERIAKRIAADFGLDFLFFALDNGNYLRDIESPIVANDGQVLFSGAAHLLAMLKLLDWRALGLLHTGQIGDLVLGSYLLGKHHSPVSDEMIRMTAHSTKLIHRIPASIMAGLVQTYETDEMFAFYERCVNGVFNGYQVVQNYSEFASPFLYLEFLDYVMKIDPAYRFDNALYTEWIEKYVSIASKYPWEKTGVRINAGYGAKLLSGAVKRVRRDVLGDGSRISMNPFEYWYQTNPRLEEAFEAYLRMFIHLLDTHPQLQKDTMFLFENGDMSEKTQALSLLAAVKLLHLK